MIHEKQTNLRRSREPATRRGFLAGSAALATGCLGRFGEQELDVSTGSEDWPVARFDSGNSGVSSGNSGPGSDVGVLWKRGRDGVGWPSVVVGDGVVFWNEWSVAGLDAQVLAADAGSGEVEWKLEGEDWLKDEVFGPGSAPVYSDGSLYLNSGVYVVSVDAGSGELEWLVEEEQELASNLGLQVVDGVVYTGMAAYDASSGDRLWSAGVDFEGVPEGRLTVVDEAVAFSEDGVFYALDPASGEVRWRYEGRSLDARRGHVARDGVVYLVDRGAAGLYGDIVAVEAGSGDELWVERGLGVRYLAVSEESIYGAQEGGIVCLDRDDRDEVWSSSIGDTVVSGPIVAGDRVYCAKNLRVPKPRLIGFLPVFRGLLYNYTHLGHNVFGLDADTGEMEWGFATNHYIETVEMSAVASQSQMEYSTSQQIWITSTRSRNPSETAI